MCSWKNKTKFRQIARQTYKLELYNQGVTMKYNKELITFKNGLRLVFVPTPDMYTARIRITFSVGSEDEKDEYGMAHLLEHEFFKGTSKYNQKERSEQFSRLAAEPNASTSAEFTTFKARFPLPAFKKVVELFSDMIFDSVFDEKELESEKNVVIEEIKMHEDRPSHLVFDELIAGRFKGSGLGNRIAGREELLRSITREQLIEFKNKHYNAKNCIICVVGDYKKKEVIEEIDKHFISLFDKTATGKEVVKVHAPYIKPKNEVIKVKKDIQQANIIVAFSSPSLAHIDRSKLYLMSYILGGTMNSRLFDKIRNQLSLCYGIYSTILNFANNGVFLIDFSTTNENSMKAINEVFAIIEDIKKNGVTDQEFEEAKYMTVSQIKMDNDYPSTSGINYLEYTGEIRDKEKLAETFAGFTKAECEEAFRKYITKDSLTVAFVGDTSKFNFKI